MHKKSVYTEGGGGGGGGRREKKDKERKKFFLNHITGQLPASLQF